MIKLKADDLAKFALTLPVRILSLNSADTMREWQISQLPAGANKTDIEERFDRAGNESGVVIQYIQGLFSIYVTIVYPRFRIKRICN